MKMLINYDIQKITRTLADFYNATGVYMGLLKEDFSFVVNRSAGGNIRYCVAVQNTEKGRETCLFSDACLLKKSRESRKPELHVCHAGLIDICVPIIYEETIIGYVIFGQIKIKEDFPRLREYITKLGLNADEMKEYYDEIAVFDSEKIESISNLAEMVVKHILLENMLRPGSDESTEKATRYINENLGKPLSVHSIAKNVGVSKSALYRNFNAQIGYPIGRYINKKRVEKAAELLSDTRLSIEEITLRVGFADSSYFSKTFKKEMGLSPLKYRKKRG